MNAPSTTISPPPPAGGAGGGRFKSRDTARAKSLRNQASPAERLLWTALGKRQVSGFKFSRQMPIGPYFADFLCREARLVIEIDGFSHEGRRDHDERRDAFMGAQGYGVLRFTNGEVMDNLEGVVRAIGAALAERCPPPTPPASGRGEQAKALELAARGDGRTRSCAGSVINEMNWSSDAQN